MKTLRQLGLSFKWADYKINSYVTFTEHIYIKVLFCHFTLYIYTHRCVLLIYFGLFLCAFVCVIFKHTLCLLQTQMYYYLSFKLFSRQTVLSEVTYSDFFIINAMTGLVTKCCLKEECRHLESNPEPLDWRFTLNPTRPLSHLTQFTKVTVIHFIKHQKPDPHLF